LIRQRLVWRASRLRSGTCKQISLISSLDRGTVADCFGSVCRCLQRSGARQSRWFGLHRIPCHCDGRANTLILILDADGTMFDDFTPVKWESCLWNGKHSYQNNCLNRDHNQRCCQPVVFLVIFSDCFRVIDVVNRFCCLVDRRAAFVISNTGCLSLRSVL
jgi:hypothetical protein